MKKKSEITVLNETINKTYDVFCIKCKGNTEHIVMTSVDVSGNHPFEGDYMSYSYNYQIVKCQGCKSISYRTKYSDSEGYGFGEEGELDFSEEIYPIRNVAFWPQKDFKYVPRNLVRIYKETIDCYNHNNFTLCAAGVRALIEGLCKDKGVVNGSIKKKDGTFPVKKSNSLEGKIYGLVQKEVLTKANANPLHENRIFGNNALHELSTPDKKQLELAIQISELTLQSVYEIPKKGRELMRERLGENFPIRIPYIAPEDL